MNATAVVALLVTAGCGLEVCDVVNCDTLFFVEELVEDLEALGAPVGEMDHDDAEHMDDMLLGDEDEHDEAGHSEEPVHDATDEESEAGHDDEMHSDDESAHDLA
ncbi:hypothetical protein IIA16_00810 [bacterium]|nr:hypothetical protein [bacterium]